MKNIYLTLLSFTLYITPALTSESPHDAFRKALEQENTAHIQELLASHDIDVNLQNKLGETALMLAVEKNHVTLTQQLLKHHNININQRNGDGSTAIMIAVKKNYIPLVEILLKRHDIKLNLKNKNGTTALVFTIIENHIQLAELLLQRDDIDVNVQDMYAYTALMFAIEGRYITLVEQLLKRDDIDVNLQDYDNKTALNHIEGQHIHLNKPQDDNLYYVNLVKRTHLPSLDKDHALLQPSYLQALYAQQPFTQAMKQYRDILLINKIANKLQEKQKTLFYQGCLLAYESKNSNYSIQARSIEPPKKPSYYQPVLDEDLTHLLANYLRKVNMKRVSYASDWVSLITCYLWTNNQFALQHNPANMSLKAIHFWSNHNSTYAELLSTANHTQKRALFKVVAQQGQYQAVATQHLARGLKQKNIIQNEEQVLEKSITQLTPIIVAGLKALTC